MNTAQLNTVQNLAQEFNATDTRIIDENLQGEPILYMSCNGFPKIREFVIGKKGDYQATAIYDLNIQISALMANSPRVEVPR